MIKKNTILIVCAFVCINSLFAQSKIEVSKIIISGNNKTKENVILRELTFGVGDIIDIEELNTQILISKDNLLKTPLFNFVDIEANTDIGLGTTVVKIKVQERWYYWAYPILEHADRNLSSFLYYRDYSKINYGAAFDWYNFGGMNDLLRFKARLGFKEHYSISYYKTGFGTKRKSGFWFYTNLFRQKKAISNIVRNKPVYTTDFSNYMRNSYDLGLEYSYRPEINYIYDIGLKFQRMYFHDSTFLLDNQILENDSIFNYLLPKIRFQFDNRNNKTYPTNGVYFGLKLSSSLFFKEMNFESVSASFKGQYNTKVFDRLFYRFDIQSRIMIQDSNTENLFDRKLDFFSDFTVRGYEYYYFPGDFLSCVGNTFSFKLSDVKLHSLPSFLPDEFSKTYSIIYFDVFSDIAYVNSFANLEDLYNPLNENFLYSIGAGLTLETYYDRLFQIHVVYNGYFSKFGIFAEYKTPIYKTF